MLYRVTCIVYMCLKSDFLTLQTRKRILSEFFIVLSLYFLNFVMNVCRNPFQYWWHQGSSGTGTSGNGFPTLL